METISLFNNRAKVFLIGFLLFVFGAGPLYAQVDELPNDVSLPFKDGVGFAYVDSVVVPRTSAETLYQNAVYFLSEVAGDDSFEELEPKRDIRDVIWLRFEAPHTDRSIDMNLNLDLKIQDQRYVYHIGNILIREEQGTITTFTPLEVVLNPDPKVVNEPSYARDMAVAVDSTIRDFLGNLHQAMLQGNAQEYQRLSTWGFRPRTD